MKVYFDEFIKNSTLIIFRHDLVGYVPIVIRISRKSQKFAKKIKVLSDTSLQVSLILRTQENIAIETNSLDFSKSKWIRETLHFYV